MGFESVETVYGPMPAYLSCATLQDLCVEGGIQTGPFGSQLHQKDYVPRGTPIITVEHLGENRIVHSNLPKVSDDDKARLSKYVLRTGDIVFSRVGSVDRRALVLPAEDGWLFSGRCLRVRPDVRLLDAQWLSYFFGLPAFKNYIRGIAVGATMPSINTKILSDIPIYFPDLAMQREAALILAQLDDRITLLRETNATLEAIAQALFKSWFVDFDPVHAKAEGREPEGMDATTAALFPDSFEESEPGLVPKGWKLVPFGGLLTHTIGGDWGDETPNEKNDTRVAIIRGTDIPDLQSGTANRVPVRYTSAKKLATRKLQDGDLVLEVSGGSKDQPTGRALYLTDALLGQFDCPVEPASFCRLLRPVDRNTGLLLAQQLTYVYGIGKTWEYQNQSTGIANFQTAHFLESELVAVPPSEVLAVFADAVRSIVDRGHVSQIQTLTSLRDTLLPRLISGQLRLPDAEQAVGEALA